MLKFIVLIGFFWSLWNVDAKAPNNLFVEGELLIQLSEWQDTSTIREIIGSNVKFNTLSSLLKIVKVSFSTEEISTIEVETTLLSSELNPVLHCQKNHYTFLRSQNIPNDTSYLLQNRFWNVIKAPEAWAKTQGGYTRSDDDIVIAVIDDGVDTAHPDLRRNLWINKFEVPNDGIDNDANGFVDDYYGWNTYDDNGIVIEQDEDALHGTPVAGLIGADGNNTTGVTGSNWDVRVMNVVGGSFTEAENIKAFDYILNQKKTYLESNGVKGAYVVAINCSWGLDGSFAKDFPIWCSFYDTLGAYGILTVAATSNSTRDIEVFGDMPSLCTSEHLVVVSNMSSVLNPKGGQGDTAVDLAAPGDLTHSLCPVSYGVCSNLTKGFNGTSGAAPLVTGLFGLMYNYGCDSFIRLSKSDPSKANLLAKKWLLEGVDKNGSFAGLSVSEGVLDYEKALVNLENWCNAIGQPVLNETLNKEMIFNVFPNPSKGKFTINSSEPMQKIWIYNLQGKRVYYLSLNDETSFELRLNLSKGIYILRVEVENSQEMSDKIQIN